MKKLKILPPFWPICGNFGTTWAKTRNRALAQFGTSVYLNGLWVEFGTRPVLPDGPPSWGQTQPPHSSGGLPKVTKLWGGLRPNLLDERIKN